MIINVLVIQVVEVRVVQGSILLGFDSYCFVFGMIMQRMLLDTATLAPPVSAGNASGDGTQQHASYSKEANFDTNMVIILAALLCALVCALGLNSIVRCALRCSQRLNFETGEAAVARVATTGVKKKALRQIPVAVYGDGVEIPASECPICLGEFLDGEKVRVLPQCNHGFHVRCIDVWLASHSSCPTCRRSLVEVPAVVAGASWHGDSGGGGSGTTGSVVIQVGN